MPKTLHQAANPSGLTFKMERFVAEYMVDGNGKRAAIAAGYSERSAMKQASDMLQLPHVRKAIEQALKEQQKRTLITADAVLKRIDRVARKAEGQGDYSAAIRANQLLGMHYKLFTEKHEHGGIGGGPMQMHLSQTEADL